MKNLQMGKLNNLYSDFLLYFMTGSAKKKRAIIAVSSSAKDIFYLYGIVFYISILR